MPASNILVVVVDGLRASALGAYGNTSWPTPALDRFAAESFLLDCCYAASVDLADIYRALWRLDGVSLPQQFKALGYSTTLIADDAPLTEYATSAGFDHCSMLEQSREPDYPMLANDLTHTSLARLFANAGDVLASTTGDAPKLVWVHSRGMYGPWDAPLELQQSMLDEGDPPPVEDAAPPDLVISAADDPDAVFRYGCAYAAQAMVLDECWEALLDVVEAVGGADRWLVTLLGARGYPLGEHRQVGGIDRRLYGEQLHVPWLIRFPDALGRLARSNLLTTHLDLAPSLVDSSDGSNIRALATTARSTWRDALVATSPAGHRAIRTDDWCLRLNAKGAHDEPVPGPNYLSPADAELFVRPDDRWEANDVAKLCPDVVETLIDRLRASP